MHPYDDLAGTVIGNVLGDGDGNLLTKGASGLEAGYDSLLVGRPGRTLKQRIGGSWTISLYSSSVSLMTSTDALQLLAWHFGSGYCVPVHQLQL